MAPPSGRFHVVPADNTISIEEFDGFEVAPRVPDLPEQRDVVPKENSVDETSAVHRVFNTTELVEMVLLQGIIPFHQLFTIQRVSKGWRNVIEGSQQLKVKMFLIYDTKAPHPSTKEDLNRLVRNNDAPLFNPLMGISPASDKKLEQIPIFRHFDFRLPIEILKDDRIRLWSQDPLAGAVEKKLKPHLGGSWEKLKICRVSPELKFYYNGEELLELNFYLDEENVTMGDIVDILSAWYSRQRKVDVLGGYLRLEVCFN